MTAAAATSPAAGRATPTRIALAGLAGGVVDLAYASVVGAAAGRSFQQVWQGVAGGWIGPQARELGWASAGLGLATHFGVAAVMAAAFALAGGRAPSIYRRPWTSGVLYGLALYAVMYRIVLPLRWPEAFPRWDGARSIADVLAHVGVGLAIVFVLRHRRPMAG
ncbi:hypothetical protein LRS10_10670 [Phenylobacterium sp. J426]|uniref:hypothetical protein n=1 Tax=Phenylobacterium sp. J426 TaxID=2898439 RepID=UPI002151E300|nr:hypothetical protein [Phenylobacterium sp. J426]MCR5874587.1 hypothetical protein [Phenylobacterium sp. J426]